MATGTVLTAVVETERMSRGISHRTSSPADEPAGVAEEVKHFSMRLAAELLHLPDEPAGVAEEVKHFSTRLATELLHLPDEPAGVAEEVKHFSTRLATELLHLPDKPEGLQNAKVVDLKWYGMGRESDGLPRAENTFNSEVIARSKQTNLTECRPASAQASLSS